MSSWEYYFLCHKKILCPQNWPVTSAYFDDSLYRQAGFVFNGHVKYFAWQDVVWTVRNTFAWFICTLICCVFLLHKSHYLFMLLHEVLDWSVIQHVVCFCYTNAVICSCGVWSAYNTFVWFICKSICCVL